MLLEQRSKKSVEEKNCGLGHQGSAILDGNIVHY
jgi:hypothetical protein